MDIKFTIVRTAVMAKVEGLTVALSQHNPGVPFETLWASAGDQNKLDLYYKEAIGDLEESLKRWIKTSSSKFDVLAEGEDYTLTLSVPPNSLAVTRLNGLVANKLQDYFAHAILASWLQDLPEGTPIRPDYATLAAADMASVQELILERDMSTADNERTEDDDSADSFSLDQSERTKDDEHASDDVFTLAQSERIEDNDTVDCRNDITNWSNWPECDNPFMPRRNE